MAIAVVAMMMAASACGNNGQKKAAEGECTECCEKEGECCGECAEGECCKQEGECCGQCAEGECEQCAEAATEAPAESE